MCGVEVRKAPGGGGWRRRNRGAPTGMDRPRRETQDVASHCSLRTEDGRGASRGAEGEGEESSPSWRRKVTLATCGLSRSHSATPVEAKNAFELYTLSSIFFSCSLHLCFPRLSTAFPPRLQRKSRRDPPQFVGNEPVVPTSTPPPSRKLCPVHRLPYLE